VCGSADGSPAPAAAALRCPRRSPRLDPPPPPPRALPPGVNAGSPVPLLPA